MFTSAIVYILVASGLLVWVMSDVGKKSATNAVATPRHAKSFAAIMYIIQVALPTAAIYILWRSAVHVHSAPLALVAFSGVFTLVWGCYALGGLLGLFGLPFGSPMPRFEEVLALNQSPQAARFGTDNRASAEAPRAPDPGRSSAPVAPRKASATGDSRATIDAMAKAAVVNAAYCDLTAGDGAAKQVYIDGAGIAVPDGYGPMVSKALSRRLRCKNIAVDGTNTTVKFKDPGEAWGGMALASYTKMAASTDAVPALTIGFHISPFSFKKAVQELNMWAITVVGIDEYVAQVARLKAAGHASPTYVVRGRMELSVTLLPNEETAMKRFPLSRVGSSSPEMDRDRAGTMVG